MPQKDDPAPRSAAAIPPQSGVSRGGSVDLGPRYEPVCLLGEGGAGRVFLVRDLYLNREVALKLLHAPPSSEEDLESLRREFALLSEIEHPGVARVQDFGFLKGIPYITSELIPGESLAALSGAAIKPQFSAVAIAITDALAFLHSRGILHLDLKPSNILIPSRACGSPAVLIDFGLVRRDTAARSGRVKGSLPYMAPEHFGGGALSAATDIYALGVTLYRTLTGIFPRRGASELGELGSGIADWDPAPRRPSEAGSPFPEIDGIVLKCLALDPGKRYPSAAEALKAFRLVWSILKRPTPPAGSRASHSPTMGRTRELERIRTFLDRVAFDHDGPHVLLVTGASGMGQTQMFREIKVEAQTRGLRFSLESERSSGLSSPGSGLRSLSLHLRVDDPDAAARWEKFSSRLTRPRKSPPSEATDGERRMRRANEVAVAAAAIREPFVLGVDGLERFDEVSIALISDLARAACEVTGGGRSRIGLILGLKEEGVAVQLLRELVAYLLNSGNSEVMDLGPLGLKEAFELYNLHAAEPAAALEAL